ncbi:MAG: hypothetical protein C3F06_01345 [Candidatus Methanoperedenaceae archaeon]|nr:MAG: hypothetical protein C3F06_01345 [Candidatus Methanoperedenaceae archaeon]
MKYYFHFPLYSRASGGGFAGPQCSICQALPGRGHVDGTMSPLFSDQKFQVVNSITGKVATVEKKTTNYTNWTNSGKMSSLQFVRVSCSFCLFFFQVAGRGCFDQCCVRAQRFQVLEAEGMD